MSRSEGPKKRKSATPSSPSEDSKGLAEPPEDKEIPLGTEKAKDATSPSHSEAGERLVESAEGQENPFAPKKVLGHSPMKNAFTKLMAGKATGRERSMSLTEDVYGQKRRMEPSAAVNPPKRVRERTPLEALLHDMRELHGMIMSHPTVKREIKTKADSFLKDLVAYNSQHAVEKYASGAEGKLAIFKQRILSVAKSEEALNNFCAEEWPVGAFSTTRIGRGNFKDGDATTSVIVYPGEMGKDKNISALANKIPGLRGLSEEILAERGLLEITHSESTAIPGMECASTKRSYLIQAALLSTPGDLKTTDVYKWAMGLREKANEERSKYLLFIPEDGDLIRTRKVLECCLAGTDVQVIIRPNKKEMRRNREKARDEAITINGREGATYAQILKDLKANVKPVECGVKIRHIATTSAGSVRLTLKEQVSGGKAQFLKNIRATVASAESIREGNNGRQIVLMGLETDIEKEEVSAAISRDTGVAAQDIKMNEFRAMRYGNKMITVTVPRGCADKLYKQGRLRIGWTSCAVKEKVDPPFCSWCQNFGHLAKACQEEKRADIRCMKCGQFKHWAKDCKNPVTCFLCNSEGHCASTMACPKYRAMVQEIKANHNAV